MGRWSTLAVIVGVIYVTHVTDAFPKNKDAIQDLTVRAKRKTADCGDPNVQGRYYKCMANKNKGTMKLPRCEPGTQTKCVPCEKEMYKAGTGNLICLTCPDGLVSNSDFTRCTAAGRDRREADDDNSEDMEDNWFLAAAQTAVAGRKRRQIDATEYDFTDSDQQKKYYEASTKTLVALKCGKGKTAICEPCPEGTFKATGNPMKCIDCPGTSSPSGARFCDADCPPGTWWYVRKKGTKAKCKKCNKRTYKPDSGPEPCDKCPDNYIPVQPTDTEYGPTKCEKNWCATSPCGPDSKGCDNDGNGYRCHCKDGTTNSATCHTEDCGVAEWENADVSDQTGTTFSSTATAACRPGFVGGSQTVTCGADKQWTGGPNCTPVVNGGWTDWSQWNRCSVTCHVGSRDRSRTCLNPAQANGWADCVGNEIETESCAGGSCPDYSVKLSPMNARVAIGSSLTITCNASTGGLKLQLQTAEGGVTHLTTSAGNMVMYSLLVSCSQQGILVCMKTDGGGQAFTTLSVYGDPETPVLTLPLTLVLDSATGSDCKGCEKEQLRCRGTLGYPNGNQLVLETDVSGTWERLLLGTKQIVDDESEACNTDRTVFYYSATFSVAYHATQLRCAVLNSQGEYTAYISAPVTLYLVSSPIDTCVQELEGLINSSINRISSGIPPTTLTDALCNSGTTNWERIIELAVQCTATIMYNGIEFSTSEYTQNFMCDDSVLHDCRDVYESGHHVTGVYSVNFNVSGQLQRQQVYCDMDTPPGGWTVFQKRFNGRVDFYRYFNEYEFGFGDLHGEFWLGLKWVYWMTLNRPSALFINLTQASTGDETFARYGSFSLDSPPGYNLHVSSWSGTDVDNGLVSQNGKPFSSRDHDVDDNPDRDCAGYLHAGYWFGSCANSNLNGNYGGIYNRTLTNSGFIWAPSFNVQLSHSQMAFRRT